MFHYCGRDEYEGYIEKVKGRPTYSESIHDQLIIYFALFMIEARHILYIYIYIYIYILKKYIKTILIVYNKIL